MRALFGVIVLGLTALAAGIVGFQAGIASNIGAAGGAVYLGGGFPGLGFLLFFLFFGFLFFAFAGRRRGPWGMHGGHGRMGSGPWGGGMGSGDPRRQWIADAHRRLHEEEARAAGGTSAAGADPFDPTRPAAG
ncbi:MAG TPA: hypothetical protein VGK16_14435 [Candidatus Limnocylindrales bacterium]|jgi:hypothetical protein